MLLTLSAQCLSARLLPKKGRSSASAGGGGGGGAGSLSLTDLPRYARDELGLFGLNLTTSLLAGADLRKLEMIREAADKASCPCLVLIESEPQPMATLDEAKGAAGVERMTRVVQAASRLGCNSVAMKIVNDDHADAFDYAAERIREVLKKADKMDVNVLIAPHDGLTNDPDRLTELVKKVGGFRIGTLPDFQTASRAPDPLMYLRRLVPYAQAVTASALNFTPGKKKSEFVHESYNLEEFAKTVASVGYTGTLALEYRGDGEPEEGLRLMRQVLESALGLEVAES